MTNNKVDHLVFYLYVALNRYIYLVVYVYDIVILENDKDGITEAAYFIALPELRSR